MRLAALTDVLRDDAVLKKVYLIGQEYSFGQQVVKHAREMIATKRPDIENLRERRASSSAGRPLHLA